MSEIFGALIRADDEAVERIERLPARSEEPHRGSSLTWKRAAQTGHLIPFPRGRERSRGLLLRGDSEFTHRQLRKYLLLAIVAIALTWGGAEYAFRSGVQGFHGGQPIYGVAFEATVRPANEIRITTATGGIVSKLFVKAGDKLRTGDRIVQLEDRESQLQLQQAGNELRSAKANLDNFRAQLVEANARVAVAQRQEQQVPTRQWRDSPERAEAAYTLALGNYNRTKMLFEAGVLAQQELDTRATELRVAQDDLQNAKRLATVSAKLDHEQVDQARLQAQVTRAELQEQFRQASTKYEQAKQLAEGTLVRATQDGVVSEIPVKIGDQISVGTVLARLAQLDRMVAEVPVAAKMISQLELHQRARVSLPLTPPREVEGRIRIINPLPSSNMTHGVEVEFDNPSFLLLAGQPAEVRFLKP